MRIPQISVIYFQPRIDGRARKEGIRRHSMLMLTPALYERTGCLFAVAACGFLPDPPIVLPLQKFSKAWFF
jgi:hypothetical protein